MAVLIMAVLIMVLIVAAEYAGIFGWMASQNIKMKKETKKEDDIELR